jgi:hypothetical protein
MRSLEPSVEAANSDAGSANRLTVLAIATLLLTLVIVVVTLAAVWLSGVALSVFMSGFARVGLCWAALLWAWWRRSPTGGDERLRLCAGLLFVLFAGLTTNVLICFAGQTLALPLIDPWLDAADRSVGLEVMRFIEACVSVPGLTGLLGVAYLSSFPLLLGSALFLGASGRAVAAWTLVSVFTMCLMVTVCGSVVLPAEGAFHFLELSGELRAALPPGSGTYHLQTLFALRGADQLIVDPTNLQGVATFPSFHTALALMTAAAWRGLRAMYLPMIVWQAVVIVSTIPIGGHYFVDLLAGGLCWAGAQAICRRVAGCRRGVDADRREASPSHAYV